MSPVWTVKYANWQFDAYVASLRNRPLGTIRREQVRELHDGIAAKNGGSQRTGSLRAYK